MHSGGVDQRCSYNDMHDHLGSSAGSNRMIRCSCYAAGKDGDKVEDDLPSMTKYISNMEGRIVCSSTLTG